MISYIGCSSGCFMLVQWVMKGRKFFQIGLGILVSIGYENLEIHTLLKYGFRNFQHVIFKKHLNWNGFLLVTIPAHDCHVWGPRWEDDFCDWLPSWVPTFAFFVKPRMVGETATRSAAGIWIMIKCTSCLIFQTSIQESFKALLQKVCK